MKHSNIILFFIFSCLLTFAVKRLTFVYFFRRVAEKQRVFQAVYRAFHQLKMDSVQDLQNDLFEALDSIESSDLCYDLISRVKKCILGLK